jgi:iron(III) transport system permease protein
METLADFGGVAAFNVNTFTTMIYKSWFGLGSFNAAARMSLMLLLPALTLLGLQTWLARRQRQVDMGSGRSRRIPLRGAKACLAVAVSTLVSTVVFVIPVLQLSLWAAGGGQYRHFQLSDLMHSLLQSLAVALMVIACALVLVATRRFFRSWLLDRCIEFSTLGYALPGTVLAVAFYRWCSVVDGFSVLPWLLGSLAPLLLGLSSRYMSVGVQSIQSGMGRVSPDLDLASRSLGRGPLWTHVTVHWPMMKGSFGAALVLVFVDVMKEMPMTLMTRPLGWDTLSVRIFEFTSEGDWEHAAVPALILIVAGLVPLLLLRRFTGEST